MRLRMMIALLLTGLTGCSGFPKPAPSCDGTAKRPLNRSLWDWETKSQAAPEAEPAKPPAAPVQRLGALRPAGAYAMLSNQLRQPWTAYAIAESYRPCGEASRHG